ncbi:MAG: hypothetical protein HLUCCA11_22320 [Phormidesmis priestleyi Ana]|uniref:Uncharacterized protein n=1 Tax=Phormidesmis priestleyi Ana TaxID=1666911 RepID=A0A0P7ZQN5_9CYAN|nr:MAG: hypothetical protein HLUCCA11_22320 [Phormidesmis priestleyi Ana]
MALVGARARLADVALATDYYRWHDFGLTFAAVESLTAGYDSFPRGALGYAL